MPGTMELLEGIAGTGKTELLLRRYAAALTEAQAEGRLGSTLWLAPNRRDTEFVSRRLTSMIRGALFAPRVLTFADFANQVLERAASQVVPLTPGQQRTLLRRIIDRRKVAGQFAHFGPIAGSTGFVDLVQSFIAELKRNETWPEDFTRACVARGASSRDRELAEVYADYQQELLAQRLFDSEGRFWWARENLRRGQWGAFATLDLVVVDGFDDFNQTQYEILGLLAERAHRMIVSLPLEAPSTRSDLFTKTLGVRLELERRARIVSLGGADGTVRVEADSAWPAPFRQIARHLFGNPRTVPRAADSAGLEIVAVAGQRGEVQWLAARIKELLLKGTPAGEIVVVLRDVAEYADLIEQIFRAAGIPTFVDYSPPLFEAPVVRGMVRFLELEQSNWEFDRLASSLRSTFFRPGWSQISEGTGVSSTLASLRRLQLGSDRETMLERLERDERLSRDARQQAQSAVAHALLRRLDRALSPLRSAHTLAGWAIVLRDVAGELGVLSQAGDFPQDVAHWNLAIEAVFAAGKVEQAEGGAVRRLDLQSFTREFSDLLRHQAIPATRRETGCVRVLPVVEIRNLDIPHLFLAGLSEQSFPRRRADDCLYGEHERRLLNDHGLSLGHHAQRTQEEMLLFYRVVTRARVRLVLSYPAVSADGAPLSPSPYVVAVRELFEPADNLLQTEEQLDPIPKAGRVLSPADLRVRAMHDALEQRPGLLATAAELPATSQSVARALAAVDLNVLRFHTRGFGCADGMLENPANIRRLRQLFPSDRQFSATHLESYGECPFRFFVERVLRVKPLLEIEFATDHGQRGMLIHSVLAQLHGELLVDGRPPAVPPRGEFLARRFQEILKLKRNALPPTDALREVVADLELRTLAEWGDEYGKQWDAHVEQCRKAFEVVPQPLKFEAPFGSGSGSDDSDGDSVECDESPVPPLIVGDGDQAVLLTGRVDRIDTGVLLGKPVFFVVDYKTGTKQPLNRTHVGQGKNLQLPLYALAVVQRNLAGDSVEPAQAAFWYLKDGGFTPGLKPGGRGGTRETMEVLSEKDWEEIGTLLKATVPRIVQGMRSGEFPVFNSDQNCMQFCPCKLVCRVNQIRPLEETLGKAWTLQ